MTTISQLFKRLKDEGGAIVSSNDAHEIEIQDARCTGRFSVDEDGFGFIWRYPEWLAKAMGKETLIAAATRPVTPEAVNVGKALKAIEEISRYVGILQGGGSLQSEHARVMNACVKDAKFALLGLCQTGAVEVVTTITERRFLQLVNADKTHRMILSNVQESFLRDIAEYISEKFPNGLKIIGSGARGEKS